MTRRLGLGPWLALLLGAALAGCSPVLDVGYGRSRGPSVNGTGALAQAFRDQGLDVRSAVRLTGELSEWADVIVRFAPYPGPPDREEADWYAQWLDQAPDRHLIYVPRDYDAEREYWSEALNRLPKNAPVSLRQRVEARRDEAPGGTGPRPRRPKETADPAEWFAVDASPGPPAVCKALDGPWADGIDPAKAALTAHETLEVDAETVLLGCGRGKALAMEWTRADGGRVLVVANGAFLLNAGLLNPARRPLAQRVVRWAGEGPRQVAFVEGFSVTKQGAASPSIWGILARVTSIRWVAIQMLVLGLAACLARAPRLGRARPEPPSGAERPVAHPEALGALMARGGQEAEARSILDAYRRWRFPSRRHAPPDTSRPPPPAGSRKTAAFPPSAHGIRGDRES